MPVAGIGVVRIAVIGVMPVGRMGVMLAAGMGVVLAVGMGMMADRRGQRRAQHSAPALRRQRRQRPQSGVLLFTPHPAARRHP